MLKLVGVIGLVSSLGCSSKSSAPALPPGPAPTATPTVAPTAAPTKRGVEPRCVAVAKKSAGDLEMYPMITPIGTVARRVQRDHKGRIRTGSHVYYDASGKKVAGIRGLIPQGVDLAYGWGSDKGGLACGIAPQATSSTLKNAAFFVTVRNANKQPSKLITALPYQTIELELRAGDGTLQPQNSVGIAERNRTLLKMNNGPNENLQSLRPNEALSMSYVLSDWYASLAPGQYRLTIRRRAAGKTFSLVSNTVSLTLAAR